MNPEQFRQRAELDESLADFLDEVAQGADPYPSHRAVGGAILFGVAAYALYRLAKNYFDHERGMEETELRREMMQEVEALVRDGWDREKALDAVLKVSREVAGLRPDSPALCAALALMKA